jgi:hypothetical protein
MGKAHHRADQEVKELVEDHFAILVVWMLLGQQVTVTSNPAAARQKTIMFSVGTAITEIVWIVNSRVSDPETGRECVKM